MPLRLLLLSAALALAVPAPTAAQDEAGPPAPAEIRDVTYDITFDRTTAPGRSLRVAMSFEVTGPGHVLLSLPAWTPGDPDVTNHARWVSAFGARRDTAELDWDKADPDTWRISDPGPGRLTVGFEILADSLGTATAWARDDFLFFSGANVFLYPEGADLETFPTTLRIITEPDWLVATGIAPGDTANTFRVASYHDLVDMPAFVGRFDFDSMPIGDLRMRLATYPAGSVAGETRLQVWEALRRMFPPMAAVFDDLPFRTYTVMQLADSSFAGASGLEHRNSHVDVVASVAIGNPVLNGLYAHQIFHAWNGKRLRPADLVPYRYDRWQPTTMLWMSEGITDYYADLAQLRGGLITPEQFYVLATQKLQQVTSVPPVALEDASLSTWISPADGTAFVYYPKGSLVGLLLDIMIREASGNRSSLDLVLRELYETTYQQGRGFTEDDWWVALSRAAPGRDMVGFRLRYVDGREPLPFDRVLPLAGLELRSDTLRQARIGLSSVPDDEGIRVVVVEPDGMAAAAGVLPGDRLVSIGEIEVEDAGFGAEFRRFYGERDDERIEIVVVRDDEELTLRGRVEVVPIVNRRLVADPAADADALQVREGLLAGTVAR